MRIRGSNILIEFQIVVLVVVTFFYLACSVHRSIHQLLMPNLFCVCDYGRRLTLLIYRVSYPSATPFYAVGAYTAAFLDVV